MSRFATCLSLVLLMVSCGRRDARYADFSAIDGPLAVGGRLTYVSRRDGRVISIDPATAEVHGVPFVERPRAVAASATELFAIGGGGQRPVLVIMGPTGEGRREIALPAAFDRLELSPDGRHALAVYDALATAAAGAPAARNANEIAVIDVASETARREVLETESLAPRAVVFSPAGDRAAVLLDSAIALVDLAGATPSLRVPLEIGAGSRLVPQQALFSPDGAFLYVQTAGGSDVLALELGRSGDRMTASINFLSVPGAGVVRDLAIAGTGPELARSVAVVFHDFGPSVAALLDATGDVSRTRTVTFDQALDRIDQVSEGLLLVHDSPDARTGAGSPYVAAWAPLDDRADLGRVSGNVLGPAGIGPDGALFFEHGSSEDGSAPRAITTVRVDASDGALRLRFSPLLLGGQLTAVASDATRAEVYLGVDVAREGSGAAPIDGFDDRFAGVTGSLVVVRADGLGIVGVPLDDVVREVGLIGDFVYAIHPAAAGDVTFVPRGDARRESARRCDGFLAAGLLEGGAE